MVIDDENMAVTLGGVAVTHRVRRSVGLVLVVYLVTKSMLVLHCGMLMFDFHRVVRWPQPRCTYRCDSCQSGHKKERRRQPDPCAELT